MTIPRILSNQKWRIVALGLLVIGSITFLSVYDGFKEQADLARLDIPVLEWLIAHRTPLLTTTMQVVTNLMAPVTLAIIILAGAGIWAWTKKELWRPTLLAGSMAISFIVSMSIKNIVERGRPPQLDMILPLEVDYSFPSGHTLGVAVCLLVLGYLLYSRRLTTINVLKWLVIAAVGIAVVAFSRLYLAYHWLTDVSASTGLALIILAIIIAVDSYRESIFTLLGKLQKRR